MLKYIIKMQYYSPVILMKKCYKTWAKRPFLEVNARVLLNIIQKLLYCYKNCYTTTVIYCYKNCYAKTVIQQHIQQLLYNNCYTTTVIQKLLYCHKNCYTAKKEHLAKFLLLPDFRLCFRLQQRQHILTLLQ